MADEWLHIGRVVVVNAARRQVRIAVMPKHVDIFSQCKRLRMTPPGSAPVQACIAVVRSADAEVTVELTPGISRDMVATLKHAEVAALMPDGYCQAEPAIDLQMLLGMRVVTVSGDFVGDVLETQETPAGGIMRLQCNQTVMAVAPVTDAFIEKIDLDAGVITVKTPEAFLVMDAENRSKKSPQRAAQDIP